MIIFYLSGVAVTFVIMVTLLGIDPDYSYSGQEFLQHILYALVWSLIWPLAWIMSTFTAFKTHYQDWKWGYNE